MKCPKCQRKQRRGREGMSCKSCRYTFLFDPKQDVFSPAKRLHDDLFLKIINHATASGSYQITANQLFSSARHFDKSGLIGLVFAFVFFVALTILMGSYGFVPGVIFGCIFAAIFAWVGLSRLFGNYGISRSKWDIFVSRWLSSGREIPGLIHSPSLTKLPQEWPEKDIHDYGVSGIILCNRLELVDWLVLNNFHAQNNKLVLTPAGYPAYLTPVAQKLLSETPELPVYLLHDPGTSREAMLSGCTLPIRNITDLGGTEKSISDLAVIQSRFPNHEPNAIPLDYIPYKTFSAAVGHCLLSGTILADVLATSQLGSDTDVSFG